MFAFTGEIKVGLFNNFVLRSKTYKMTIKTALPFLIGPFHAQ